MRCPGWPCDTLYAVLPEFRTEWRSMSPIQILGETPGWPRNICITGGEPFLQKSEEMVEYVAMLASVGHTIEFFTNGSFPFPREILNDGRVTFMMDWKLQGSGESNTALDNRVENLYCLGAADGVKFVVANGADLFEALEVWKEYRDDTEAQFWVGAAWQEIDNQYILDFITEHKLPWKVNVQVHKYIWSPDERGV